MKRQKYRAGQLRAFDWEFKWPFALNLPIFKHYAHSGFLDFFFNQRPKKRQRAVRNELNCIFQNYDVLCL